MKCDQEILIDRVKQGDREAQRALYDCFAPRLLSLVVRYVGRRDLAEDITHDAFIKIFNKINTFEYRGDGSLRAWVDRVTVNMALEWLRENKKINLEPLNSEFERHNPPQEPLFNEVEEIPQSILLSFIADLPPGYRTVLNMFCIEGCSHREIATELGINEKSSASQLLRAKRLLANKIKAYLKDSSKE